MKVHIDRKAHALYILLNDDPITGSEEVQPGIILDFNAEGLVVGVEILGISKQMSSEQMQNLHLALA